MTQSIWVDAVTQPLLSLEVLLPLPCGMPQCIAHRYRLQPIIRYQDLDQVLCGVEEVGVVEEGAPAVQSHD